MQSPTRAPRRGTKMFAMAMLIAQVCALGRYTVLARILGPEQLGLAATLILAAQFFDTVSDSGGDRFLIQDAAGDDPRAQALVQLVALGRGLVIALALVLFAWPIAAFFREPQLAGGLVALALMPLIGGAVNFDFRRRQRDHDFRGESATVMVAELVSLIVTTGAALIVRDFTAVVYGLVARAAAMVAVSHLTATRRYAVVLAREHAPALWKFGAPLLMNGLLLFFGAQSDRLLVGRLSGLEELGLYSAILLPIMYPSAMLTRFMASLYLPRVSANAVGRRDAEREMASFVLLASVLMAAGFAAVAPIAVPLIFGPAFKASHALLALVGIYQATRFVRVMPTAVALGAGESRIVLAANLARLVAVPLAIALAMVDKRVESIVVAFVIGEAVALVIAGAQLRALRRSDFSIEAPRVGAFAAAMIAILSTSILINEQPSLISLAAPMVVAAIVALFERATIVRMLGLIRSRLPVP